MMASAPVKASAVNMNLKSHVRSPKNLPESSPKPLRNLPETSPKPPRNLPETSPKPPRNLPETSPKPPRNLSETSPKPPRHLKEEKGPLGPTKPGGQASKTGQQQKKLKQFLGTKRRQKHSRGLAEYPDAIRFWKKRISPKRPRNLPETSPKPPRNLPETSEA